MRDGAQFLLLEADHGVDRHHVQIAVADRDTGVQRVDDLAVASVDGNVGSAAVVGDDVARLDVAQRDLLAGKRPLIVSGASLGEKSIVEAAANIAQALKNREKNARISEFEARAARRRTENAEDRLRGG